MAERITLLAGCADHGRAGMMNQKLSAQKYVLMALALVLLLPVTVLILSGIGAAARTGGSPHGFRGGVPTVMVDTAPDIYANWKRLGMHGRLLLHFGRFVHFVPIEENVLFAGNGQFPVRTTNMLEYYEQKIDNTNFLWVATQANIGRSARIVMPPSDFRDKYDIAVQSHNPDVSLNATGIVTHYHGTRWVISDRVIPVEEPVLVSVDASYFAQSDPASLLAELVSSGISTDLMILYRGVDNPEVTDRERQRLNEFAKLVQKGSPR